MKRGLKILGVGAVSIGLAMSAYRLLRRIKEVQDFIPDDWKKDDPFACAGCPFGPRPCVEPKDDSDVKLYGDKAKRPCQTHHVVSQQSLKGTDVALKTMTAEAHKAEREAQEAQKFCPYGLSTGCIMLSQGMVFECPVCPDAGTSDCPGACGKAADLHDGGEINKEAGYESQPSEGDSSDEKPSDGGVSADGEVETADDDEEEPSW